MNNPVIKKRRSLHNTKYNRISVLGNKVLVIEFSIFRDYLDRAILKLNLNDATASSPGDQLYRCRAKLWYLFSIHGVLNTKLLRFAKHILQKVGVWFPDFPMLFA